MITAEITSKQYTNMTHESLMDFLVKKCFDLTKEVIVERDLLRQTVSFMQKADLDDIKKEKPPIYRRNKNVGMFNGGRIAQERLCVCNSDKNKVFLGTVYLENHELESLQMFYCPDCNSFWKEP